MFIITLESKVGNVRYLWNEKDSKQDPKAEEQVRTLLKREWPPTPSSN